MGDIIRGKIFPNRCATLAVGLASTCRVSSVARDALLGHSLVSSLLFDESHICPDHPRCASPTKVDMWGGVPDVANHAKFH